MRALILLTLIGLLPLATVSQVCYYPDGSVATEQFPCTNDEGGTFCCADGEACLANKLCYFNSTSIFDDTFRHFNYRGSCTDKSWQSENCPDYCTENKDGRDLAWKCEESDKYHCKLHYQQYTDGGDFAEGFCDDADAAFILKGKLQLVVFTHFVILRNADGQHAGETSIITEVTSPSAVNGSPSTSVSTSTTTTLEETASLTRESFTTRTTSASSRTSTTEAEGTTSTNPSSSPRSTEPPRSSDNPEIPAPSNATVEQPGSPSFSTGLGVGIGVGVGVVVLALAVAAIFFFRRRRRRAKADASSNSMSDGFSGDLRMKPSPSISEAPDTVKYEAEGTARYEAADTTRYEAPANQIRHELVGS
ncbi:hypothetical protein HJFPF1_08160 [Paramyrothecium foliicola]|nr:hypothetical protein HJFPF1_08160 [Paramyrothecium foliicola]